MNGEQWATLRAVADRIVPRDAYPSASESGILTFFERLLPEQGLDDAYAAGLDAIDAIAIESSGQGFVELSDTAQDEVLSAIERSGTDAALFFRMVAEQTIDGYYADPGNGANRDRLAWEMIGYRVTA